MERSKTVKPLFVKVNSRDNVAVVVNSEGLNAGTPISDIVKTMEFIPQAHKIALKDFKEGKPVRVYCQIDKFTCAVI